MVFGHLDEPDEFFRNLGTPAVPSERQKAAHRAAFGVFV
jgi:hypothetical protein